MNLFTTYFLKSHYSRCFFIYALLFIGTGLTIHADTEHKNIPANLEIQPQPSEADMIIQSRLTDIFQQIEHLKGIDVKVQSGVVTLSGEVPDSESGIEAVSLTKKTSGVIYVINQFTQNVDVVSRLEPAKEKAKELAQSFIKKLPLLAIAITVAIVFWILGSWVGRRKNLFSKFGINDMVSILIRRVLKLLLISLGIFFALEIMDATAIASAVLGIAGVAGIALGFAFRNIVENYLAGILLSIRNPFTTGNAIEIDGLAGKVICLTSRDTVLMTFDGNHLRIPNSKIMTSSLLNFSRNPLRRFDFSIALSADSDFIQVKELGMQALLSIDSILEDPAPNIVIESLENSRVTVRFFAWIDQRESDFLKSKSESIRLVKERFDGHQVEMPEPIYRVMLKDTSKLAFDTEELKKDSIVKTESKWTTPEDTCADHAIDKQMKRAQESDNEENLLDK